MPFAEKFAKNFRRYFVEYFLVAVVTVALVMWMKTKFDAFLRGQIIQNNCGASLGCSPNGEPVGDYAR